ncbi:glycine betaine ABC transporter substrate-binding protein [Baekduia sp.]|jgi:glycine betaine/choline ABC-type transport system substrate-binding protein/ABC-type proline/glycine betaine transport system permease subunit|uniref:glycine betaine ABC transporter substrate-binding protein n=1 Tax=Baekduia sp. TaxID=2600305 RepID=UPI002E05C26E|nr:glycine betaine ABC transporter substrate-binding protein [Baekduia sp.]
MKDAINYLLHSRESVGGGVQVGGSHLLPLLWTHLRVTFEAIVVSIALSLPLGLWLGHKGKGQFAASTAANVGRAVPSFAVLVFASTYLGLNAGNLVFAMVLLAIPPIFTNTYVGVRQVDRDVVDAARGMGLSERQLALRVELPLALPLVFGGIRTSVVNVLATATLGPYVGVDTLGVPIINANVHGDAGRLGTALLIALLAIAAELLFAALQRAVTPRGLKLSQTNTTPSRRNRRMRSRSVLALLLLVLATVGLAACGSDDNNSSGSADTGTAAATTPAANTKIITANADNGSKPTITIGSKNFTEEFILGEIYAQALQAAGYKVKKQLNLGSEQIALKALKAGRVDAYPEYTGTILTSFCKVKDKDVSHDPAAAFTQAKTCMVKDSITAENPTPFTDSNGFAVTQATAKKLGNITTLSDLKGKASTLTISGPPECQQRIDCLLGLEKTYGLKFKKFLSIDLAKRHEVIKNGQTDVGEVFTTDGQIKADNLVLLKDDMQLFPPYNATLLAKTSVADAAGPDFVKTVNLVTAGLTLPVMQELNSRVDLDKEKPAAVAAEYLKEAGYLQ